MHFYAVYIVKHLHGNSDTMLVKSEYDVAGLSYRYSHKADGIAGETRLTHYWEIGTRLAWRGTVSWTGSEGDWCCEFGIIDLI